ncbi:MAG: transposase, partial [Verrucomicrobiota bacterium]
ATLKNRKRGWNYERKLPDGTLAYNMGNFLRQAVLPRSVRHWTMTTLREKLIKIGAKVVHHSRQVIFQMAEVAVPRELFRDILMAIESLRMPSATSG